MNYWDYFSYSIYKACEQWDRNMKLYYGPAYHAAQVASLYPVGILFLFSVYLGVWDDESKGVAQFFTTLFLALIYVFIFFYTQRRLLKVRALYEKGAHSGSTLRAVIVNLVIGLYWVLFIKLLVEMLG